MNNKPFFSIIIPAHNEEGCISKTIHTIVAQFVMQGIEDYEILIINDNSTDNTKKILKGLVVQFPEVRYLNNNPPHGFGFAVRKGLENYKGEAVAIVMADLSDSPEDILKYYHKIKEGAECVFGSRFCKDSQVVNYPKIKLMVNRIANIFIKILFRLDYNDITNAFKCYRREVINGIKPILSHHFNLTVELPLKAIVRGYSYEIVPISWTNRETGESKLILKEMGSRYLFIVLYVWLERLLSRNDYHRMNLKKCGL